MSVFHAIGFPVQTREHLRKLTTHAANVGHTIETPHGYYICWSAGAGVELWVHADREKRILGCFPHFLGHSRIRLAVQEKRFSRKSPMRGSVRGMVNPTNADDPETGVDPVVISVPDFDQLRTHVRDGAVINMQVAAFAQQVQCFLSEEAFDRVQAESGSGLSSESFIPANLLSAAAHEDANEAMDHGHMGEQTGDHPRVDGAEPSAPAAAPAESQDSSGPVAMFTGRVLSAERRENPRTEQPFYAMQVQTLGGVYDVVSALATTKGQPSEGGIVQGVFALSGRLSG